MADPEVDLHGMSVEDALRAADAFIDRSFCEGKTRIRIITGKGRIYNELLTIVRNHPLVEEVENDGPLGFRMEGSIILCLADY